MKDRHVGRGAHRIVIFLFLAATGCGGDSGTNGGDPVATASVTVSNDFFNPANIQVLPGATVTWTWAGGSALGHNVTFASIAVSAPSDTQMTGTFEVTMPTAAGTYSYQCTIHGSSMSGSVTVGSGSGSGGVSYNLGE